VRFPYQGRYPPATRPDTLEDGDVDGAKDGTSSDRCSSGSGAVWVFCLASGGLSGIIWIPFERRVSSGAPLGSLWPLLGAWVLPAPMYPFPFLAWSWIPLSSADFGTCPGNHSASIFQVYSFAVVQWGLLRLLGESTPAPEVTGWTTVNVHIAMHLLEMRPIKYVVSGGLLFLFSLQLLHLHLYRSVALLLGGSPVQSHEESFVCPLRANGVGTFSGCLSTPAAFSMQSLSFSQEAFRVFRPED
jgi:hypothetical protein